MVAACGPPPEGRAHWTLQLPGEHLVALKLVASLSPATVARALKNALKPWQIEYWRLPPEKNAAFVCAMEDVLSVYERPRDPLLPLVYLDEFCQQLLAPARPAVPAQPGTAAREDYEYVRCGKCA